MAARKRKRTAVEIMPDAFGPAVPIAGTAAKFHPPKANSGGDRTRARQYPSEDSVPQPVGGAPSSPPEPGDLIVARDNMGTYWQGPAVIHSLHPHSGGIIVHTRRAYSFICVGNSYGRDRGQWQYADEVSDEEFAADLAPILEMLRAPAEAPRDAEADMITTTTTTHTKGEEA